MTTPEHIKRIIERLEPVDREALERHLKDESIMGQMICLQEIRAAIGDHYGKLMQDEVVSAINNMVKERDELAVRVETIKQSVNSVAKQWFYEEFEDDLLEKMERHGLIAQAEGYSLSMIAELQATLEPCFEGAPATSLAEVRARAVDELAQERNALGRERNELSASCHRLALALQRVIERAKEDDPETWAFAGRVLAATPTANMAEVQAEAIEQAATRCEMEAALNPAPSGLCRKPDLLEYAKRIRQEAE